MDALRPQLNGKWGLDHARSESLDPFLEALGVPPLFSAAARAATPLLQLAVGAAGLEVTTHILLSAVKNTYSLNGISRHTGVDGSVSPSRLVMVAGRGLILHVQHARGVISQLFERVGAEMHMYLVLTRGGVEVVRVLRVHARVTAA